jgi:hypothetical protein
VARFHAESFSHPADREFLEMNFMASSQEESRSLRNSEQTLPTPCAIHDSASFWDSEPAQRE